MTNNTKKLKDLREELKSLNELEPNQNKVEEERRKLKHELPVKHPDWEAPAEFIQSVGRNGDAADTVAQAVNAVASGVPVSIDQIYMLCREKRLLADGFSYQENLDNLNAFFESMICKDNESLVTFKHHFDFIIEKLKPILEANEKLAIISLESDVESYKQLEDKYRVPHKG